MTAETDLPAARLWTRDGFREDSWRHVQPGEADGRNENAILLLADYLSLSEEERRSRGLGVLLLPADPVEAIAEHLPDLALVALSFPAFSDGRSYSKAALLRERHRYEGRIRASGDVLIDQIPLMLRMGFDEFEVSNPTALARLDAGRLGGLPVHYQQATAKREAKERYSWRRLPG